MACGTNRADQCCPTIWELLALSDIELEKTDLVVLNLSVAQGIAGLEDLDVARYVRVVDEWTEDFRLRLPGMERRFHATPQNWKGDLRFFRVGMLQGFLGHIIGLRYIEELKDATAVYYSNPGQLFLHGLIDTKQGTCGNMPALHAAISRRMGWPVSLACAKAHLISRFDDGEVVHNIEATSTEAGTFASDPDEKYIQRFKLPKRAIECGSDLRSLSARQMMAVFLRHRARYVRDLGFMDLADSDYALSRVLFPQNRHGYINGMVPMLRRGAKIFDPDELGHPNSLFDDLSPVIAPGIHQSWTSRAKNILEAAELGMMDVHLISLPRKVKNNTTERVGK